MTNISGNQPVEFSDETVCSFGRKIELELLDRHQPTGVWLIGTVDRAEHAGPDLMEDPEGSEGVRRRSARSVRMQRRYSSREGTGW